MKLTIEKYYTTEGSDELFFEFDCDVTPGSDDHFCNGHGNWLPGDIAECKITEIRLDGIVLGGEVLEFIMHKYAPAVIVEAIQQSVGAA